MSEAHTYQIRPVFSSNLRERAGFPADRLQLTILSKEGLYLFVAEADPKGRARLAAAAKKAGYPLSQLTPTKA